MFQKKEKQFFFIETKSRIHRLSCHFRRLEFVGYGAFSQSTSVFIKCENSH